MSNLFNNKNDKQAYFNQIRGTVDEINLTDGPYHNITLVVGHENPRPVNLLLKTEEFERLITGQTILVGEKVCIKFYLKSKKRDSGFYSTIACVLDVSRIKEG